MLRQQQIKRGRSGGPGHHPFQKGRIKQVLEIAEPGIAAHPPGGERVQLDVKFLRHGPGFGNLRAENVDFMAAADQFFDQVDRLGRTAAGRRVKRFVRQECDPERKWRFAHALTLCNPARAIQSQSAPGRQKV